VIGLRYALAALAGVLLGLHLGSTEWLRAAMALAVVLGLALVVATRPAATGHTAPALTYQELLTRLHRLDPNDDLVAVVRFEDAEGQRHVGGLVGARLATGRDGCRWLELDGAAAIDDSEAA
jgi:hypothetical protein